MRVGEAESSAIDTNVFVHASNPGISEYVDSVEFFIRFLASNIHLALDGGYLILNEYEQCISPLAPGNPGKDAFVALVAAGRVQHVAKADRNVHDAVAQLVVAPDKARDRTFLKVASRTTRRELVSHDFEDYPARVRDRAKKKIGVHVCTASDWSE